MELVLNLRAPNCSQCNSSFSCNGYSSLGRFKTPHLLHCGHSSCEKCLLIEINNKNDVICNICKTVTTIPASLEGSELSKSFPINYFLLGLWHFNKSNADDLDAAIKYTQPKINKRKERLKQIMCNECMETAATTHCKQCSAPYCNTCFKTVHLSARAFRNHHSVPILESYLNVDPDESCSSHTESKLEFYCLICKAALCPRCMISDHKNHNIELLEDMKGSLQDEFIESYAKVSNVLQRLKATKKRVESLARDNKEARALKSLHEKMHWAFTQFHGKLIVHQNNMHMQLSLADTNKHLDELLQTLNDAVSSTEALLVSTKALMEDESKQKKATLIALSNTLKKKEQQPCFLLEERLSVQPSFTINEELLNTFDELCKVTAQPGNRFKLVNETELPPDHISPNVQEVTVDEIRTLLSKRGRPSSESSSTVSEQPSERPSSPLSTSSELSTCSVTTRDSAKEVVTYPEDIAIGCQVRVRICHLVSPADFFVQRECAERKLLDFQKSLRSLPLRHQRPPSRPSKGHIYLVLYEKDSKWYRARILEMLGNKQYKVLYIDFGNTEHVSLEHIRTYPKNVQNIPVLAIRCKLNNCVPRHGKDWDPQAITFMTEVIEDDYVIMLVVDKIATSYVVDLFKVTPSNIINIQQALCFNELCSMASDCELEATKEKLTFVELSQGDMIKLPKQAINKGEIMEVHVSHVASPHEFYCQNLALSKKLIKMAEDLQRAYNIRNKTRYSVYDPKKGMLVVARYSKDSKWYRGRISNCLNGKMIRVFFIDFGNEEDVHWDNVKILQSRFSNLAPQAIKCILSDIMPADESDEWSDESCAYLHSLIFDKILKLVVDSVEDESYISVVLYRVTDDLDLCINAVLVREKHAISIGSNSTVAEYPKVYSKPPTSLDFYQCEVKVEKSKKAVRPVIETPMLEKDALASSMVIAANGSARMHIYVKRIVDPGEFYVTISCFKGPLITLKNGLKKYYNDLKDFEIPEWKVGDRCIVKHNSEWFRAVILDVLPEDKYRVNLTDEGEEVEVDKSCTRVPIEKFMKLHDGAFKCHLGGLKSTLDSWSSVSISEFKDFVHNNQDSLFMCQLGQIKGTSLPVELFSRTMKETGPLDPMISEWRSINHYLRFIGQAKADEHVKWDCEGNILNWKELYAETTNNKGESVLTDIISTLSLEESGEKDTDVPKEKDNLVVPSQWLPLKPLEELAFVASPTYVDKEGYIYLHDFHRSSLLLEEISKILCMKYDKTLPKPFDETIKPGDICIAQYHLDKKWYRAVLLNVIEEHDEYEVKFVDYGNVENCKLFELRKIPICHNYPVQAVRCFFHTIKPIDPTGKWHERHIEIIQFTIVDKNCQVKLVKIPDSDVYGIEELKLPDGLNYIAEIVREGYAFYRTKEEVQKILGNVESVNDDVEESSSLSSSTVEKYSGAIPLSLTGEGSDDSNPESVDKVAESSDLHNKLENYLILTENEGQNSSDSSEEASAESKNEEKPAPITHWWSLANAEEEEEEREAKLVTKTVKVSEKNTITKKPKLIHWTACLNEIPISTKPSVCYQELALPEEVDSLLVEVTAFLSPTILILHLEDVEEDEGLLEKIFAFKELSLTLQEEAPLQPPLSEPYCYKVCCAKFSADENWYRAFVLEVLPDGKLLIQFVDYGNVEIINPSEVRELKEEWSKLEVMGILCELHNISPSEDASNKEILVRIIEVLSAQASVKAIIKERTDLLKVDLFAGETLAYESLIDERLLILE